MKKVVIVITMIIFIIVMVVLGGYFWFMSGKRIEFREDMLSRQIDREKYFDGYGYTLDNPNIIVNPYEISPLTALVIFEVSEIEDIEVTVVGKDNETTYTYLVNGEKVNYVPIYGLYENSNNSVIIKVGSKTKMLNIQTDNIDDFEIIGNYMDNNISLVDMDSYSYAVDKNGDIRWYLSGFGGNLRTLDNGNLLLHTNRIFRDNYYTGFVEMDMLGKIYYEYSIDNGGYNGNYVMDGNNIYIISKDYINVVSNQSGEVFKSYKIDRDYNYIDIKDKSIICSDGEKTISININNNEIEESNEKFNHNNIYNFNYLKKYYYKFNKGIRLGSLSETDTVNTKILLFNYSKLKDKDIEIYKEIDRLVVRGTFNNNDDIYFILDGVSGKRIYKMNKDENGYYIYVNSVNLKGRYTMYFSINDKLYKSKYYVDF